MRYHSSPTSCAICDIELGYSERWKTDVVVLSGPHWPLLCESRPPIRVNDVRVSRHATKLNNRPPFVILLRQKQKIRPQATYGLHRESQNLSEWEGTMFVGLHAPCEDLANRVMKKSFKARLRSIGDLWLTLERRCASRMHWKHISNSHFTPEVPDNKPSPRCASVGFGRDFLPSLNYFKHSWWNEDPVTIPNLTALLIANLKPEEEAPGKLPETFTGFKKRLECLPQELKDLIYSFLHHDQLPLDCTYIMPQSMWKQVFFQVPFLWDLDVEEVYDKTSAGDLNGQNWDWEKITRQVMTPPEVARQGSIGCGGTAWSFKKVGLSVPDGFTNRRRIWQILEEM